MARLYKVGDYGEMKLGEFRKNIMQYTRNNLRSIIRDSDPEIVEIAESELDRRGEERKKGGLIDKPLGPGGKKKKKKGKKIMAKYATGKYAKAISDRSGMEFPYKEMVREWNGAFVHVSEFEPKQPQLEPKPMNGDSISLRNVRPDRIEPAVAALLKNNPFSITSGSQTITVSEPNHGRSTSDTVRFRNVVGSPGGVAFTTYENSSGFSITVTTTDKYTFTLGATPSITEESGGPTVSAGPVTLTA